MNASVSMYRSLFGLFVALLVTGTFGCGLFDDVQPAATKMDPANLTIDPETRDMKVGETFSIELSTPNGDTVPAAETDWVSKDEKVATVDKEGVVTAVGQGSTTIEATWKGATKKVGVSTSIKINDISISSDNVDLNLGKTKTLSAKVVGPNDYDLSGMVNLDWSSTDSKIAEVDGDGVVKAKAAGTATIKASKQGKTGKTVVTVKRPTKSIDVSHDKMQLAVGESRCATATPKDNAGAEIEGRSVSWKSGDEMVAKVSQEEAQKGKVTAQNAGTTKITATSQSASKKFSVEVSKWAAISSGRSFSCGVTTAGNTYCWGADDNGQLGDGPTQGSGSGSSSNPVPVEPSSMDGSLPKFEELYGGANHTCALAENGEFSCWGDNRAAQVGVGRSPSTVPPPTKVNISGKVADLALGFAHTCAALDNGSVFCWGATGCGQSGGDGQKSTCTKDLSFSGGSPTPSPLNANQSFTQVAAGHNHTCGIAEDGNVYCWGRTSDGQLGNGEVQGLMNDPDGKDRHFTKTPQQVSLGSGASGPATPIKGIAAGDHVTCILDSSDAIWCWGRNDFDQAGPNCHEHSKSSFDVCTTPSKVPFKGGGTPGELYDGSTHMCMTNQSGLAFCWGRGAAGELGHMQGGGSGYSEPQPEFKVAASGVKFVSIESDRNHNCGVTQSGEVRCWGANDAGQIGNGSTSSTQPALPTGLTFAKTCASTD